MPNHQQLLDDFHRAMFVDHDPDAIARLYAEDATMTDATRADEPIRGREAIVAYHAAFLRAFPDLSAEQRNSFGSGEWFVAEYRITGTHAGPLELAPDQVVQPTGRRIDFSACWLGRLTPEGLCSEDHTYYDSGVFAGLLREPAAPAV